MKRSRFSDEQIVGILTEQEFGALPTWSRLGVRRKADAFGGYGKLYDASRQRRPILEVACGMHARRPLIAPANPGQNARLLSQDQRARVPVARL